MVSRISEQYIACQADFATTPKSHRKFWSDKFARNVANDKKHTRQLRRLGWRLRVVWECQLRNSEKVLSRLHRFLKDH